MEQLTYQISVRVSDEDLRLLKAQAEAEKRSIAWIARENIRKGLASTS